MILLFVVLSVSVCVLLPCMTWCLCACIYTHTCIYVCIRACTLVMCNIRYLCIIIAHQIYHDTLIITMLVKPKILKLVHKVSWPTYTPHYKTTLKKHPCVTNMITCRSINSRNFIYHSSALYTHTHILFSHSNTTGNNGSTVPLFKGTAKHCITILTIYNPTF